MNASLAKPVLGSTPRGATPSFLQLVLESVRLRVTHMIMRRDARRLLERAERYTSTQPGFAEDLRAAALAHLR
ncbi:MAG: hypothetical protein HKL99_07655 [Burkholderiales bacterium]|nr:hypothetical protein [Burkholderiales bacterium]